MLKRLIVADLHAPSYVNLENEVVWRYTVAVHNLQLLCCFVVASALYLDAAIIDGVVFEYSIRSFGVNPEYINRIASDPLKVTYLIWTIISLPVAGFVASRFYWIEGGRIERADLVSRTRFVIPASIMRVVGGILFAPLFFFAGYLSAITFFERTGLDQIPGVIILQAIIALKMQAYVAISEFSAFIHILPYRARKT